MDMRYALSAPQLECLIKNTFGPARGTRNPFPRFEGQKIPTTPIFFIKTGHQILGMTKRCANQYEYRKLLTNKNEHFPHSALISKTEMSGMTFNNE